LVESPAKSQDDSTSISRNDFIVKSKHRDIRDFATSGSGKDRKQTQGTRKGLLQLPRLDKEDQGAHPTASSVWVVGTRTMAGRRIYEILPGKGKVIEGCAPACKDADTIYLADGFGPRGEALPGNLRKSIGG